MLLFCWSCSTTEKGNSSVYNGNQLATGDGVASINKVDNSQTWENHLRRLPGVMVSGRSPNLTVRIRSQSNSFLLDSSPLFVLDNTPMGNDFQSLFSAINLADVESITVLKNAGETSMWGLRGSNGVIVVRSKKPDSSN